MTGPEHLREGKRLLAHCDNWDKGSPEGQSLATEANGHLLAALACAVVADRLEKHTAWKEAAEA